MAEPRQHEPKLAALEAYRTQRLGSEGRARIERHLATCEVCREALVGMQRYAQLADAGRALHPPAIDWSRMDLPLQREAARLARRQRLRPFLGPLALSVAAALGLFLSHEAARRRPEPELARALQRSVPPAPSAVLLRSQITAMVGAVDGIDASGKRVALDLDSSPSEGWTIETGAQSELHLALEGTAALIIPASSRLSLSTAREGDVVLTSTRGQIINHVRKLGTAERYEVAAAGHRVAVRGTRFGVELIEHDLDVEVDEGAVAVLGEDGSLVTELRAPQRWQRGGAVVGLRPGAPRLHRPREAGPSDSRWPVLELPTWSHVVAWDVDGSDLGASATLRMRAPPGDIDIGATLDDGRRMHGHVRVDAFGTRFDPRTLRFVGPQPQSEPAREALDPAKAAAVIHASEPALQRCYERALRGQADAPSTALRLRLRLEIDPRGRVKHVNLVATQTLPTFLTECVQQIAERWRFQAPGASGITFEAPVSFRPAQ